MQKEIRKRTQRYSVIAVISALVLVAFCFSFGVVPFTFPPEFYSDVSPMSTFGSYEELRNFIVTNSEGGSYPKYSGGRVDAQFFAEEARMPIPEPAPQPSQSDASKSTNSGGDFSTTNIQVAGVDEVDYVKNDGTNLYLVSKNKVYIVKAYPPEDAAVLSDLTFEDSVLAGIFLSQDNTRLAVIGSVYEYNGYSGPMLYSPEIGYFYGNVDTFIKIFDISNKAAPVLTRDFTTSGSYFNSRMVDNYVYAVVSQPASVVNETVILPKICEDEKISEIEATRIFYSNVSDDYYTFTTYIGLNILDNEQEPTNMTIMTGSTSNMYVSPGNVYVTYWSRDGTEIHRIRIDEGGFAFEAEGKVPGYVLNQFSMDENNEYFRLATNSRTNGIQQNNVYVLNMNLSLVGKLENLAVGEDLHSARFMGDKCYLVTFETVDPLFVIDLSQPNDPKVLGELKIPGYSDYLHPYDENHLIGVGKETVEAIETDWAWYQGVKLSLFDVSNVNDPKQLDTYVIGDRGTDSPILWDHKAFLFDKPKNLLVIPVTLAEIDKTVYPPDPRNYGTFVWQGAYVFGLTTGDGFVLRGTITHVERDLHDSNYWINRALYIGNVLYTVSNQKVVLNNLTDLSPILEVYLK